MERNFDLHVSVQFKGGQYYRSFSAKTYADFENALRDAWYDTGLSVRTGEIFISTTVDLKDGPYDFELGYYKVEEDNETIIGLTEIPEPGSPEHIICTILNIDISDPSLKFDEESFFNAVSRAIVKHQKSWAELSQATHKKVEKLQQLLAKEEKQKLKREAYYQCTACSWVGSPREMLVRYFDFNQEPADDPEVLRDRLNSGPNSNELWLKSSYVRLCPKCLEQTKTTQEGEALFARTMEEKIKNYRPSKFRSIADTPELNRIDLCYGNEEARICCNPSKLYESIRFRKLSDIYEQIMGYGAYANSRPTTKENDLLVQLFDQIYREVFFETLHYGK